MKILAMVIASTFVGHRKYFRWPSQVLSFFEAVLRSADGTRYQYDESTGNYYLQSETSYADARHRALCPWRSAKNRHPMICSVIFLRDK